MKSFAHGLERKIALAVSAIGAAAVLSGCISIEYAVLAPKTSVPKAASTQPYENGNTIQGMVVAKQRTSSMGYLLDSPGVVEALDLMVQTPDGRCYRVGAIANKGMQNSSEALQFDELTARIKLGEEAKVSGLDPEYKGMSECKRQRSGVPVALSQIEVTK